MHLNRRVANSSNIGLIDLNILLKKAEIGNVVKKTEILLYASYKSYTLNTKIKSE